MHPAGLIFYFCLHGETLKDHTKSIEKYVTSRWVKCKESHYTRALQRHPMDSDCHSSWLLLISQLQLNCAARRKEHPNISDNSMVYTVPCSRVNFSSDTYIHSQGNRYSLSLGHVSLVVMEPDSGLYYFIHTS
jgi:hypothetical protein